MASRWGQRKESMTTDSRIADFMAGRTAGLDLTGQMNKEAKKADLVKGYQALHSLTTDGWVIRDIMKATGLSKGKVERDVRVARIIATLPKVDPVTAIKACNVASAAQIAKATKDAAKAGKALGELVKADNAKKRAARPKDDPNKKGNKKAPQTAVRVTWETLPAAIAGLPNTREHLKAAEVAIAAIQKKMVEMKANAA